jgi:hypothetical protein
MTNQAAYIEIQSRIWKLLCMKSHFGGCKVKILQPSLTRTGETIYLIVRLGCLLSMHGYFIIIFLSLL